MPTTYYCTVHWQHEVVGIVAADAKTIAAAGTPDFIDDYHDSIDGLTAVDPIIKLRAILHGMPMHVISGPDQYDGTPTGCISDLRGVYGF